ncbi:transcriptional regulator, AlpA family [Salinimicrobium catena]|uniref:Transcriptional regulator, AlpA family n=1 Tax=Salinimicrobium catena TaxID=390640 RepID=A0A1H5N4H0_9FLAO|nr:helix-turn-helix domain-containing protein [Salinimicrobium catena]SDL36734.1 transcriptional regulator, AlpA family [Salinimicrobium catena]SEE96495.1 transcriptional regulator, AlpA family [Salinimicrobium catena]
MRKVVYEVTEENAHLIAKMLLKYVREEELLQEDQYLTIDELCELIGYKKTSIYGLVQKKKIPFHKKGKLYFLKSEIMDWLKNGKKTTSEEIQQRANDYLIKNHI